MANMPCLNFCGRTVDAVTIVRPSGTYAIASMCEKCRTRLDGAGISGDLVDRLALVLEDAFRGHYGWPADAMMSTRPARIAQVEALIEHLRTHPMDVAEILGHSMPLVEVRITEPVGEGR